VKNRLDADRRCYGFFHPRLPDEPLIFVEVALHDGDRRQHHAAAGRGGRAGGPGSPAPPFSIPSATPSPA
jgi:malonyl-CoA decarboxylase